RRFGEKDRRVGLRIAAHLAHMIGVLFTDAENPPHREFAAAENAGDRPRRRFKNETHRAHPSSLTTRVVDGGYLRSRAAGRTGRSTRLPPQFGQTPFKTSSAQAAQNVHSKVQMRAIASGGKSLSQHSQFGLSSSIKTSHQSSS